MVLVEPYHRPLKSQRELEEQMRKNIAVKVCVVLVILQVLVYQIKTQCAFEGGISGRFQLP